MSARGPVTAALVARSVVFWVTMSLVTVVFALLAVLAAPMPYPFRFSLISRWTAINLWCLKTLCRLSFTVEGLENVPASPAVVLCKHSSAWETLALQTVFRPQVWVLKRELLWIPFFGWGLATLKPIAIDRKAGRRAVEQVVQQGRERLHAGMWVVVFPEGTRIPAGQRGRYRMGGAILAEQANVPVVPVAHNAGDFWPRNSLLKWPGTITMVIGPPIASEERGAAEVIARTEDWIEETVNRLRAPYAGSGREAPSAASTVSSQV